MPLLCASVCILPLLPLFALSCNSTKSLKELGNDYKATIHVELNHKSMRLWLTNSSCSDLKHRPQTRCMYSDPNIVTSLFNITCGMKNLNLPGTTQLLESVQLSVDCYCPEKIKEPKRRGREYRQHRQKHRRKHKLCRAKMFLSAMAECYEVLNSLPET